MSATGQASPGTIKRGLLAGRFQPFHRGHLTAVEQALTIVPEVIIGVAAVEANLTVRNPFTCCERLEMIWGSLNDGQRARCLLMPLPDNANNSVWLSYARQYLPRFVVAFTNNPVQEIIMRTYGVPTRQIAYSARQDLQGSFVRSLMIDRDGRWRDLVPTGSLSLLDDIGAEDRLHALGRESEA